MEREEYRRLFELEDRLWWFVGMRELSLTLLERFLASGRPLRILDAGCGTAGMLSALGRFGSVVGFELSSEALGFARRREEKRLVRGSLLQLPFASAAFDLVTSFDVIYHLAVPDDRGALSEMARVLRSGGTLLLRVPAHDRLRSRHDRAVHTRQRYGRRELREKLEQAGLQPVYLSYANCLLFPAAVARRWVGNILPGQSERSEVRDIPAVLNRLLLAILRLEARAARLGRLPFGLSLIAVARRRET